MGHHTQRRKTLVIQSYGNGQLAAFLRYFRKLQNVSDVGCPKYRKETNLFAKGGNRTG